MNKKRKSDKELIRELKKRGVLLTSKPQTVRVEPVDYFYKGAIVINVDKHMN